MPVCLCHGLSEAAILDAVRHGAVTPEMVYRHHGVTPQCRECTAAIRALVRRGNREVRGQGSGGPRAGVALG